MVRARACNDPDNHLIRGSKVMTLDRIFEWTRPYAIGLGVGLFAAPIVGFNAGWLTTTTASTRAAETAQVDAFAGICSSAAGRMAAARSTDLAAIKGFDNRAKRDEFVAAIMTDIQVPAGLAGKVGTNCSRSLS